MDMGSLHASWEQRLREVAIRHATWVAGVLLTGPYLALWAVLRSRPWPTSSWAWRALLIADLAAAVVICGCYVRWKRQERPAWRGGSSRPGTWPLTGAAAGGAVVLVATAVVAFTYQPVDSCETPVRGAALEVMVIWKGDELKVFCDVVELYGHVEVQSVDVRMADALDDAFADGDPPDVAIVPQPSLVRKYAGDDRLCPIDDHVNDRVPDVWRHFTDETVGNSGAVRPYGAVVKGTLKSMFWYQLDALEDEDVGAWTLDDLKAFTRRWASQEDGGGATTEAALRIPVGDRWPLTDLFELLLASGSRRDVYVDMLQGDAHWDDPAVIVAVDFALYFIGDLVTVPGVVDTTTEELADLRWEQSPEVIEHQEPVLVFGPSFLAGPVKRLYGSDGLWPTAFPAAEGEQRPFVVAADFAVLPRPTNDCGSGPGQEFVDFLTEPGAIRLWSDLDPGFLTPNDNSPFAEEESPESAAQTPDPEPRPLDDVRAVLTTLMRPDPPTDNGSDGPSDNEEQLVFDLSDDQLARLDPAVTWQIMRDFYDDVAGENLDDNELECPVRRARLRLAAEYENTPPPKRPC
jgi:hypothetical protein